MLLYCLKMHILAHLMPVRTNDMKMARKLPEKMPKNARKQQLQRPRNAGGSCGWQWIKRMREHTLKQDRRRRLSPKLHTIVAKQAQLSGHMENTTEFCVTSRERQAIFTLISSIDRIRVKCCYLQCNSLVL